MSFKFTPDYIYAPDASLGITDWRFNDDLRRFFPKLESNDAITKLLIRRKVVQQSQTDPEYSCSYFYFATKQAAVSFLKRLNAVKEIATYETPKPIPEEMVAFDVKDWRTIRKYLHENLTGEQWNKLVTGPLKEIGMYEIICFKNGVGQPMLMFKAEMEAEMKRLKKVKK